MADPHPGSELLERFLADALAREERRMVVRHLLTRCPECTAITGRLWSAMGGPEPEGRRRSASPAAEAEAVTAPASRADLVEGEGETALLEARAGFLARGAGRDAALASLDLALLYLREGRLGELRELAGELYPIFAACDLQREAMLSLLVFRRSVESETASAELLVEIARYLAGFASRPRRRAAR